MSKFLVSSIPPQSTTRVLSQLQDESEAALAEGTQDIDYVRGPFGVFGVKPDATEVSSGLVETCMELPQDDASAEGHNFPPQILEEEVEHEYGRVEHQPVGLSPWLQALLEPTTAHEDPGTFQTSSSSDDNELTRQVSPGLGFLGEAMLQVDPGPLRCDAMLSTGGDINSLSALGISNRSHRQIRRDSNWTSGEDNTDLAYDESQVLIGDEDNSSNAIVVPANFLSFSSPQQDAVLAMAIPLLQHYATAVTASMSPFRHSNTPWHTMFLSQVKICLAGLTLSENVDDTGLTTFYGSLAVSALSLGLTSQSQMWLDQAKSYHRQACGYARAILTKPFAHMNGDEYRANLIALLTMVQMSIFSGRREQTEGFLLEAEKLVRIRGLARRKSRKARLLHHCYVYMRLFHESTSPLPASVESTHRRQVRQAVECSGVTGSSDNLSFRLLQWDDLSREMTVLKPQLEGENDLHIARPGRFPTTMYPEIFGVPEDFMFLLSQVIRLGNEKDLAESGAEDATPLCGFMQRARVMEMSIDRLQSRPLVPQADNNPDVLPIVLHGMQIALSIYFYRRVYDVSSSMLQQRVAAVRDWLFAYDEANSDQQHLHGSFGLVWPAFVAACEAESLDLQESFRQWFHAAPRRSGLACDMNLEIVEKVWRARNADAGGLCGSWSWLRGVMGDRMTTQWTDMPQAFG